MKPITRTRRSTLALAAATLVLTLAACGSDEEPEVVEGSVAEEESSAESAEEGTAESAGEGTEESTDEGAEESGEEGAAETEDTGGSAEQDTTGDDGRETTTGTDEPGGEEGESGGDEGESGSVASEDVEAARAGLARYLEANRPETPQTSTNIPGCPVIEVGVLEQALADAGHPDTTLEGWGTEIEWNEYEDISPDLMGVVCGGDSDGNPNDSDFETASGMVAIDLTGHSDFESLMGTLGVSAGGADLITVCPDDSLCTAMWHRDGLVIGTVLMAEGADEQTVGAMLDSILPDALTTLAAN